MSEIERKFALDNTLRNIYLTLRRQGCLLMAIKFEYNGTTYHVDTAAEAATLQRQLKLDDVLYGSSRDDSARKVWTADLAMDLLNGIGELQKKMLAELAVYGPSVKSSVLVEKMGIETERLHWRECSKRPVQTIAENVH